MITTPTTASSVPAPRTQRTAWTWLEPSGDVVGDHAGGGGGVS